MMLMVASTASRQTWAWGCPNKGAAPQTPNHFVLPHQNVALRYDAIANGRFSISSAASGYSNKHAFKHISRSQSRSEPSDTGNEADDDGDQEEEYEGAASAGQIMCEENLEILIRAAMNLFHKYTASAIQAMREVLPPAVSTELALPGVVIEERDGRMSVISRAIYRIAFAVKGSYCVGILWVLRALLEVFCSLTTYVFAGLLVVRFAWSVVVSTQANGDSTWSPRGN